MVNFKKHFLLPALIGAVCTYAVVVLMDDDAMQRDQINRLEDKILDLEFSITQKDEELKRIRAFAFDGVAQPSPVAVSSAMNATSVTGNAVLEQPDQQLIANELAISADQKVKDLSTQSDRDPRSFAEKVNELLAINPGRDNIAIVTKGMSDLADNPELLPDHALETLYQQQQNPDLKRVVAQVLSARGDNRLIEKQISAAQAGLANANAGERQKALVELAKTRHASAANTIAPLLQDEDTGVKLDALLALRATGNQSHVYLVEALLNHPDPAVSWLAKDVIDNLQNLSERARTRIASADIVAELPAMNSP